MASEVECKCSSEIAQKMATRSSEGIDFIQVFKQSAWIHGFPTSDIINLLFRQLLS